jgi:hypothetical protein
MIQGFTDLAWQDVLQLLGINPYPEKANRWKYLWILYLSVFSEALWWSRNLMYLYLNICSVLDQFSMYLLADFKILFCSIKAVVIYCRYSGYGRIIGEYWCLRGLTKPVIWTYVSNLWTCPNLFGELVGYVMIGFIVIAFIMCYIGKFETTLKS